jgi:hypothetical protein
LFDSVLRQRQQDRVSYKNPIEHNNDIVKERYESTRMPF